MSTEPARIVVDHVMPGEEGRVYLVDVVDGQGSVTWTGPALLTKATPSTPDEQDARP